MAGEREIIELELLPEAASQFKVMMDVFHMEEPEELVVKMMLLMEAALNVSSEKEPDVLVSSADRKKEMGVKLG